jgi:hypothetical protein
LLHRSVGVIGRWRSSMFFGRLVVVVLTTETAATLLVVLA